MLSLTRALLALRRREAALNSGDFTLLPTEGGALAYARSSEGRRFIIVLDIESRPARVRLDANGRIVVAKPDRSDRRSRLR